MTESTGATSTQAQVVAAYGDNAALYIELFADTDAAHEEDRALIERWAATIDGPILDAGCGPGHWTAFLHDRGHEVAGIDATPEFLAHARRVRPELRWSRGDLRELDLVGESLGGILAWYSLIHMAPDDAVGVLRRFADALAPGGGLLLGFFSQSEAQSQPHRFDHRITTAWAWPMSEMSAVLEQAGLTLTEGHERPAPRGRVNAAIVARKPLRR
jgi:trans-aconitate methyltransferase